MCNFCFYSVSTISLEFTFEGISFGAGATEAWHSEEVYQKHGLGQILSDKEKMAENGAKQATGDVDVVTGNVVNCCNANKIIIHTFYNETQKFSTKVHNNLYKALRSKKEILNNWILFIWKLNCQAIVLCRCYWSYNCILLPLIHSYWNKFQWHWKWKDF